MTEDPVTLASGTVLDTDADVAPRTGTRDVYGPRLYHCSFMAAGRVKRADQTPSDWLIPPAAIQQAEARFSGVPCYLDHPELYGFGFHQEPKVAHLVGVTTEAHYDPEEQVMLGAIRPYHRRHSAHRIGRHCLRSRRRWLHQSRPVRFTSVCFHISKRRSPYVRR